MNWNKKMTLSEFKKSRFCDCLKTLETVEDINWTQDAFSYQHFYVIYCKFWELDRDHDMTIDLSALRRYDGSAMTESILSRVIAGYGKTPSLGASSNLMSYQDFIWFILSVEEKRTPSAIEYWFRCLDLDGDGCISLYEMRHFFEEQHERMMRSRMCDLWKFEDFVCSLLDLIKPKNPGKIMMSDLKRSSSAQLFFDMLFDLRKYDAYIRRIDPIFRDQDDVYFEKNNGERVRLEGFQKFAAKAYAILADEESNGGNSGNASSCSSTSSYSINGTYDDFGPGLSTDPFHMDSAMDTDVWDDDSAETIGLFDI
eukprot:jgi/Hompol1/5379/HPOL_001960-RA